MLQIKSKREIEKMRASGKLVAAILREIKGMVAPGISLIELDKRAEQLTIAGGAKPAFKGYMGFRHTLCTSVNEQVVHGVPSDRKLKEGEIVGVDFGLVMDGYYGDSAITVPVGKVSAQATQLMKATCDSLYAAIDQCHPGKTLKDVAGGVEKTVAPFGYGIVRDFVGHGIGQKLHEEPQVPNYVAGASNLKLRAGMTIAIEPMVNEGSAGVRILGDKWTTVTEDGRLSAHFEHTILITDNGPEILTDWEDQTYGNWLKE